MADEDNSNNNSSESPKENVIYQRKKNIISGVDNDLLLGLGVATAIGIGIVNLPQTQEWLRNIFRPGQPMQLPQIGPQLQGQQPMPMPNNGRVQYQPVPQDQQLQPEEHVHEDMGETGSRTNIPTTQEMIQQANETRLQQQQYQQYQQESTGNQGYNSFNGLPDRDAPKKKKIEPYVPGSNVSGGLY